MHINFPEQCNIPTDSPACVDSKNVWFVAIKLVRKGVFINNVRATNISNIISPLNFFEFLRYRPKVNCFMKYNVSGTCRVNIRTFGNDFEICPPFATSKNSNMKIQTKLEFFLDNKVNYGLKMLNMYKNNKIKHQKLTGGQYRFFVIFQN